MYRVTFDGRTWDAATVAEVFADEDARSMDEVDAVRALKPGQTYEAPEPPAFRVERIAEVVRIPLRSALERSVAVFAVGMAWNYIENWSDDQRRCAECGGEDPAYNVVTREAKEPEPSPDACTCGGAGVFEYDGPGPQLVDDYGFGTLAVPDSPSGVLEALGSALSDDLTDAANGDPAAASVGADLKERMYAAARRTLPPVAPLAEDVETVSLGGVRFEVTILDVEGDLKRRGGRPGIALIAKDGRGEVARFTWDEARDLVAAVTRITNIAEFG